MDITLLNQLEAFEQLPEQLEARSPLSYPNSNDVYPNDNQRSDIQPSDIHPSYFQPNCFQPNYFQLSDIQSHSGDYRFDIDAVGIAALKYPLTILDCATGQTQNSIATIELSTHLSASQRGTHMSRFVAELDRVREQAISLTETQQLAEALSQRLDDSLVYLQIEAPWFRRVRAPKSGLQSMQELGLGFRAARQIGSCYRDQRCTQLSLKLSAKALCPCSKSISERGAHNQRTDLKALLTLTEDVKPICPESYEALARLMEQAASSPIYPLLKREDEKFITELAYDNPVFVEDLVRRMAQAFGELSFVRAFTVEAYNHESIHAHDCFGRISWQRPL